VVRGPDRSNSSLGSGTCHILRLEIFCCECSASLPPRKGRKPPPIWRYELPLAFPSWVIRRGIYKPLCLPRNCRSFPLRMVLRKPGMTGAERSVRPPRNLQKIPTSCHWPPSASGIFTQNPIYPRRLFTCLVSSLINVLCSSEERDAIAIDLKPPKHKYLANHNNRRDGAVIIAHPRLAHSA